mmetsp:Transcript_47591/g.125423  ORF Transcript_47591/g.125423 Transcript_47591/m.125423 type:complete len:269 (+) Transcript_47591:95-901(+)
MLASRATPASHDRTIINIIPPSRRQSPGAGCVHVTQRLCASIDVDPDNVPRALAPRDDTPTPRAAPCTGIHTRTQHEHAQTSMLSPHNIISTCNMQRRAQADARAPPGQNSSKKLRARHFRCARQPPSARRRGHTTGAKPPDDRVAVARAAHKEEDTRPSVFSAAGQSPHEQRTASRTFQTAARASPTRGHKTPGASSGGPHDGLPVVSGGVGASAAMGVASAEGFVRLLFLLPSRSSLVGGGVTVLAVCALLAPALLDGPASPSTSC